MAEVKIPDTFNGEPTKYTFFDGFTQASLPMKILYVLGVPWLSAIMEAYRYNKASKNADAARQAVERQANSASSAPAPLDPEINVPAQEAGTRFRDEAIQRKAQQTVRTV